MHKLAFASIVAVLTVLVVSLWSVTVRAETWVEGTCTARPMVQGVAGEWVTTCELTRVPTTVVATKRVVHRVASRSHTGKARTGRTVVVARLGVRAQPHGAAGSVVASR